MGDIQLIRFFLCLLLAISPLAWGEPQQLASTEPGADANWLKAVQERLAAEELQPSLQTQDALGQAFSEPTWHMVNRSTNLRSYFDGTSWLVQPRAPSDGSAKDGQLPGWSWRYSYLGISRSTGEPIASRPALAVKFSKEQASVTYGRADGVQEWYTNHNKYLEQGFLLSKRIPLKPDHPPTPLRLHGRIQSSARLTKLPKVNEGVQVLTFSFQNVQVLEYSGLKVTDARGESLPSWLEVSRLDEQQGEYRVDIVIDDASAMYPLVVDPVAATPGWTAESDQGGAYFGVGVSTAGDVNRDGFSDVIVGAPFFDNGETDEGRVYLYLGGSSGVSTTPAWTAESDQEGAWFGESVSTAGDVNGDGFSDVIVGARLFDNGETDEGRAYLYLGSSNGLDTTPAWTAESNQGSAWFGASVSTAGDVNGDGLSDVIVGARLFDNGETDEGRVYLYLGSNSGLSPTPAWSKESDQTDANIGFKVSTAGDVNGDGFSDVIVAAHAFDNGEIDEGRVYLYLGSSNGLSTTPAWTAEGDQLGALLGVSVSTAGDVNGDGFSDVIVGAHTFDNGETDEGRAYVYLGSSSGLSLNPVWTKESDQTESFFGWSVSTAGDVNGDGFSDVIVGSKLLNNGETDEGRAYLYLGSSSGLSHTPAWTAESDQAVAWFGYRVSTAGDVNGDGFGDVIVGSPFFDNGEADEGRAFIYYGSADNLSTSPAWTGESDQSDTYFGASVSTAGDVNGDGFSDVIVGAYAFDNGETNEGRVYLYLGSSSGLSLTPAWTAESDQADARFGFSVSTAGDVNGDGFSDVIIGAPRFDNGDTDEGRAYLYLGSSSGLSLAPVWTAESDQAGARFGEVVSTAGDVNGDGFSDVLVGAPSFDNGEINEGRAYLYIGSSSGLSTTYAWTTESDQVGAGFGQSVSTAGDVNGDGLSDVLVGAPAFSNGEPWEGRAYLFLGSSSGPNETPTWTSESDQSDALFGWSVSSAGDVNGDGFSDVLVGAHRFDNGELDEGRAFLYLGHSTGLSPTPFWTAESNTTNAQFGESVHTAGDVNGDGFSDIIIGAYDFPNDEANEGRAYLYLGTNSGPGVTPAWMTEGNQTNAQFGNSVSTAGDVNGDGFSDVLVGGHRVDNGETDEGRAYLYYGNNAGGLSIAPLQQNHTQDTIQPLGASTNGTFYPVILARVSAGRTRARLVYEVKPITIPFDGTGLGYSSFSDIGLNGSNLTVPVTGLATNAYHWRVRLQYFPHMNYSPWYSTGNNGANETDFLMLPSPTPTPTSTPTNTLTATATPTLTLTNTPTPTPTSTPTNTPTATATPTLTLTNTPTPTLTPTPTTTSTNTNIPNVVTPTSTPSPNPTVTPLPSATPRVPATEVRGVVQVNGQPLANVVVVISGLGMVVTDANGIFSFTGAKPNSGYTLTIAAPVIAGKQVQARASSGLFREVKVEGINYNPYNCSENNHSALLLESSSIAQSLHELASTGAKKTRKRTERTKWAGELNQTAAERWATYLATAAEYPLVTLACATPLPQTCRVESLKQPLDLMKKRLKSIRKAAVRANRVLLARGIRSNVQSKKQRADLKKLIAKSNRILSKLPEETIVCE